VFLPILQANGMIEISGKKRDINEAERTPKHPISRTFSHQEIHKN
jgi:hypothetical protein